MTTPTADTTDLTPAVPEESNVSEVDTTDEAFIKLLDIDEADDGATQTEPAQAGDPEESDVEEEAPKTSEQEGDDSQPESFTLSVDGMDLEFTGPAELKEQLEQRIADGLRMEDYTRKTQAVADERRELESTRQAIEADRAEARRVLEQYEPRIERLDQALETLNVKEPDDELRRSDPEAYNRQLAEYNAQERHRDTVRRERDQLKQDADALQQGQLLQRISEEQKLLLKALPDLSDPEIRRKKTDEWTDFGRSVGFSDAELAEVVDHRAILLLDKAMRMDRLEKKHATLKSKPTTVPTVKPGAKATAKSSKRRQKEQARDRLLKEQSGDAFEKAALLYLEEIEGKP